MRKFGKIALVLFVTMLAASWSGSALAWQCPAPKPIIAFQSTTAKVKYNTSNSAWNLTGYHGGQGGGITLGLAYSLLHFDALSHYAVYQGEDGKFCVVLDKIKVFYRARPIVWLSKEFPRGSCEFNEVLYHENKHVKTLRKYHKETAKEAKQWAEDVVARLRPVGPINEWQLGTAQDKLQAELERELNAFIEETYPELGRRQTMVDSPAEYERVAAKCDNWGKRLRLE